MFAGARWCVGLADHALKAAAAPLIAVSKSLASPSPTSPTMLWS